jgi:hypothetical protein
MDRNDSSISDVVESSFNGGIAVQWLRIVLKADSISYFRDEPE